MFVLQTTSQLINQLIDLKIIITFAFVDIRITINQSIDHFIGANQPIAQSNNQLPPESLQWKFGSSPLLMSFEIFSTLFACMYSINLFWLLCSNIIVNLHVIGVSGVDVQVVFIAVDNFCG